MSPIDTFVNPNYLAIIRCAVPITSARLLLRPEKKVLVVCLAGAGLLLRPEKKVLVVCLAGARSLLQPEKKVLVICLVGARSLLRPEKKDTVVCLADTQSLLRLEKKSSSRLSGGCAIVITTGKKKFLSSVWRVCDRYYDQKKKEF